MNQDTIEVLESKGIREITQARLANAEKGKRGRERAEKECALIYSWTGEHV